MSDPDVLGQGTMRKGQATANAAMGSQPLYPISRELIPVQARGFQVQSHLVRGMIQSKLPELGGGEMGPDITDHPYTDPVSEQWRFLKEAGFLMVVEKKPALPRPADGLDVA